MSLETWYLLEDGSVGDPSLINFDKDGVLRHKDGRAVAYGPHGPRSRGCVDAAAERAKYTTREVRTDKPKRGSKNREMKAE